MKRYDWYHGGMDADDTGEYVLYAEAEEALRVSEQSAADALAVRDREIALLRTKLEMADALINRERQKALPPDVLTVQAQARILDWEGSRGIVTPARYEGKHPALAAPYGKDESK